MELIRDDLRELERYELPWSKLFAARMRARAALLSGERSVAMELLRSNSSSWNALSTRDEAARDQWALGCVQADAEGPPLMAAAEDTLRVLGIADPRLDMSFNFPELTANER
jgi:hypothetical protein